MLRQLLLIPFLAPLLAVLLVGAINPRPAVSLRLLVWSSPALPLGVWIMLAAAGGGALSALGSGLALRGSGSGLQRQVRRPATEAWEPATEQAWQPGTTRGTTQGAAAAAASATAAATAGPGRPPGEPSPTVEVPYRVIRRGGAASASTAPRAATPTPAAPATSAAGDGWGQPASEEW